MEANEENKEAVRKLAVSSTSKLQPKNVITQLTMLQSYEYWRAPEDTENPFLAIPIVLSKLEIFSENPLWRLSERLILRQKFYAEVIGLLRERIGFKQLDITSAILYEDDEENLKEASKWMHPHQWTVDPTPLGKRTGYFFVIPLENKDRGFKASTEQTAKILQELGLDSDEDRGPVKVIYYEKIVCPFRQRGHSTVAGQ